MPKMARRETTSKISKQTSRTKSRTSTPPAARPCFGRSRSMSDAVCGFEQCTLMGCPIDVYQVTFFKTQPPIEPVSFVHRICSDAIQDPDRKRSRWTRRLTPMTMMGKATEKGLEEVTKAVLGPHFHAEGVAPKKVRHPSSSTPSPGLHAAATSVICTPYHGSYGAVGSGPGRVTPLISNFPVGKGIFSAASTLRFTSATIARRSGRGRADQDWGSTCRRS